MTNKRMNLKIYGDVQGVFYRIRTKEKADKLGLVGWVRNEPDGTVLLVAEGTEENLKKMIDCCYNGIKHAKVDRIDIEWKKAMGEHGEFKIRYD